MVAAVCMAAETDIIGRFFIRDYNYLGQLELPFIVGLEMTFCHSWRGKVDVMIHCLHIKRVAVDVKRCEPIAQQCFVCKRLLKVF